MSMGDLMELLRDYQIILSKQKMMYLFNKYSTMGQFVDFPQFLELVYAVY